MLANSNHLMLVIFSLYILYCYCVYYSQFGITLENLIYTLLKVFFYTKEFDVLLISDILYNFYLNISTFPPKNNQLNLVWHHVIFHSQVGYKIRKLNSQIVQAFLDKYIECCTHLINCMYFLEQEISIYGCKTYIIHLVQLGYNIRTLNLQIMEALQKHWMLCHLRYLHHFGTKMPQYSILICFP